MPCRRNGLSGARMERRFRRFSIWIASVLIVSGLPFGVVASIVGGYLNVPWHLPAAFAIAVEPMLATAFLLVVLSLRAVPSIARRTDRLLPCARPSIAQARGRSQSLSQTDLADSLLWGVAASFWALAQCGPVLVAMYGTYLNQNLFAYVTAALSLAHAGLLVWVLRRTGLYEHVDALAAAKKRDGYSAVGVAEEQISNGPKPISGLVLLTRVLGAHAIGAWATLWAYWTMAPEKVLGVWRVLATMQGPGQFDSRGISGL